MDLWTCPNCCAFLESNYAAPRWVTESCHCCGKQVTDAQWLAATNEKLSSRLGKAGVNNPSTNSETGIDSLFLTASQVAKLISPSMTAKAIYAKVSRGAFQGCYHKQGKSLLFNRRKLLAYLERLK